MCSTEVIGFIKTHIALKQMDYFLPRVMYAKTKCRIGEWRLNKDVHVICAVVYAHG